MSIRHSLLLALLIFLLGQCVSHSSKEKRLLLNDPNYFESRISQLEALTRGLQNQLQQAKTNKQGFAGGGWWDHTGAGSNYLCLPRDPEYGNRSSASISSMNYIYGVEYESNFWGAKSHNEDAPCSVCQSKAGSTVLMIPGRSTCYTGWTRQYKGYLASNHYNYKAQYEYVCVDENPQYLFAGEIGTDGALFHAVLSSCGDLQCPPYENNKPLTCVVCSK